MGDSLSLDSYTILIKANDGCELFLRSAPAFPLSRRDAPAPCDPIYGDCILLMHGFSGSSRYFLRNLSPLSSEHWVIAPDMRGHGESGRPDGGYHVARLAMDLHDIVRHIRSLIPQARILPVGCSIGAAVLWTYVELFGDDDFVGFVFVDQAPLQDRSIFGGGWDERLAHRGCFDETSMLAAMRCWVGTPHAAHKGLVSDCLGYRFKPLESDSVSETQKAEDEKFFTDISALCDGVWLSRLLADHTRYDHREAIETISKPTLVMAGERTGCFPLEGMKETVRRVEKGGRATARWEVFQSGHWLFYEEAERFNELVAGFFRESIKVQVR